MTAKEMFEALGFKIYEEKQQIQYERIREDDIAIISFIIEIENVYINSHYLSLDLLKAINQQCKELGWLDE